MPVKRARKTTKPTQRKGKTHRLRDTNQGMCGWCGRYHWLTSKGTLRRHEYPSGGMCKGSGKKPERR